MADYPYINTTGKLKDFFEKIQGMGVPSSATTKWLPSIGFGSKNYRPIIKILKFIGFIDSSNKPTNKWNAYRVKSQSKTVMASCIMDSYSDLFQQYPDAHKRKDEDLTSFFTHHSTFGIQVIKNTVSTFKALCLLADFEQLHADNNTDNIEEPEPSQPQQVATPPAVATPSSVVPSVHIDIQVHISSDASPEQIDKIFESMAKHLYKNGAV